MRLKIKIPRRLFGDAGKNRTGHETAVILFGLGLPINQNDEPEKLWIVGRQVPAERTVFFPFFVTAVRSDFLCGASFAGNRETGHGGGRGSAAIADDAAKRLTDL